MASLLDFINSISQTRNIEDVMCLNSWHEKDLLALGGGVVRPTDLTPLGYGPVIRKKI